MAVASSDKSSLHEFGGELAAELAEIRHEVAELGKTLSTFGKTRLSALPDMASHPADEMLEKAREALKDIRRDVSALEHKAGREIMDHPAQTVLVAIGLGVLVAFLFRR